MGTRIRQVDGHTQEVALRTTLEGEGQDVHRSASERAVLEAMEVDRLANVEEVLLLREAVVECDLRDQEPRSLREQLQSARLGYTTALVAEAQAALRLPPNPAFVFARVMQVAFSL